MQLLLAERDDRQLDVRLVGRWLDKLLEMLLVVLVERGLAPLLRKLLGLDLQGLHEVWALIYLDESDFVVGGVVVIELDFGELGHGLADDVEVGELGKPVLGGERGGGAGAVEGGEQVGRLRLLGVLVKHAHLVLDQNCSFIDRVPV